MVKITPLRGIIADEEPQNKIDTTSRKPILNFCQKPNVVKKEMKKTETDHKTPKP